MIKIIHTADVHLGRRFPSLHGKGNEYRNQLLRTFEKIVDLAITEEISLLLIAGDLFDTNRVHGITIAKVQSAFKKLDTSGIQVCILPGTHDAYDGDSIYRFVQFPANVVVFTPEHSQKTFENLNLTVYGTALDGRSSDRSPVKDFSLSEKSEFHIGMAHCSIKRPEIIENDTMLLDKNEIAGSGLDYLALGHWHSYQDLSQGNTKACYCGSPEPIDMDQRGAGNVCMVTLNEKNKVEVVPVRVGTKKFETITIDVSPLKSLDGIIEMIKAKADQNCIVEVALTGPSSLDYDLNAQEIEDGLNELFFHLRVLDKSHPKLDEVKLQDFPEETVMGRFLKIIETRTAKANNEKDKLLYEDVLKLGAALLQGRLQALE